MYIFKHNYGTRHYNNHLIKHVAASENEYTTLL